VINTGALLLTCGVIDPDPSSRMHLMKATSLLAGLALAATASAHADNLYFSDYQSNGTSLVYSVAGAYIVPTAASYPYLTIFGESQVKDLSSGASFLAFCIEPGQDLTAAAVNASAGQSYTAAAWAPSASVQQLYSLYYGGIDTAQKAGAFQLALWELTSDDGNTATGSMFGVPVQNPPSLDPVYTLANSMINASKASQGASNYTFTSWTSPDSQDMLQATLSVAAVPEPSSYGLMMSGLGVMGWLARRRRPE
jgi:PEP-CTERM motif